MAPIIDIRSLAYTYPDGRQALWDISLQVQPGEKVALLGANGAGKSTLLLHLNGILTGRGQVRIAGLEPERHNLQRVRAMVGMVFQHPDDQLFTPTVFEDVAYGPTYQGLGRAAVAGRVAEALAAVHMEDASGRNPWHLSGGEKKRIAIASVLSMQPQILVLDEPTAGLDPRACRELTGLLQELPQTQLIATHDLGLARALAGRAVILKRGRIAADGPTAEILSNQALLLANDLA
jgi:cobalt/nickel transport system ATP-binding protein